MSKTYSVTFSELKSKVGIDDVAYSMGYRLDRKAGVGRYIELVLGDPQNPSDTIIVRNTSDKASQTYFRRNGSKGDVITFIRENLNFFSSRGDNEWAKVANVLADFAHLPVHLSPERQYVNTRSTTNRVFEPERYLTATLDPAKQPWFLKQRGFDDATITAMSDRILLIRDTRNTRFDGYNVGFPYINPESEKLSGYEIRGAKGFKSKASGTDSANSAWIADFPKDSQQLSRNVFFFESSYDAMAFYQLNRTRLALTPFSLVSVGGSFNPALVEAVMNRYPAARAWDCFDNDPAGQAYSATLVKTVDKVDFSIEHGKDTVTLKYEDRTVTADKESFVFSEAAKELGMTYTTGHKKAPANFKDWNDCLLGKAIQQNISPSKYERDENLRQRRMSL